MIDTVTLVESSQLVPYRNQAIEEYLLNRVRGTEMILYLGQNDKTVVIGRNQNAWKECNCSLLEADGGFLARRISGGGAVYHDKGNLNFTFAAAKENYDVLRQMNVILAAVKSFGIHAECSGRNDVTVDGRKFSGNAYYDNGTNCMHHGTLLLTSSAESIEKYLTVSKAKLEAKGVDSVKSRVTVLSEYEPSITIATMKAALVKAAQEVFCVQNVEKQNVEKLHAGDQNTKTVDEYEQKFSSWNWRYGKKFPFTCEDSKRFSFVPFTTSSSPICTSSERSPITPPVSVASLTSFLRATVQHISLSCPVPSTTYLANMLSGSTCNFSRSTGVQLTTTPATTSFLNITSSTE